jgi:hypothetical protein
VTRADRRTLQVRLQLLEGERVERDLSTETRLLFDEQRTRRLELLCHPASPVVERALAAPQVAAEAEEEEAGEAGERLPLVGRSPAMQEIYRTVARLTTTDLTVMITGESGTGKELVSRALHDYGRRRGGPFIAINMAAIPRELTAEMCRLVLLGLAPALVERNLQAFSESLYELQRLVGQCFAGAQGGGVYADPLLQQIVEHVRAYGIPGVGQSSWGPALYAVTADQSQAELLTAELQRRFCLGPGELLITEADNHGASIEPATYTTATDQSSHESVRKTSNPPRS